ncbi:MAG: DUF4038 domain-containing protein [Planctomycetes bacterium]|nr:DUF4038 domain-containing protein [Planctomycetota bacterium]
MSRSSLGRAALRATCAMAAFLADGPSLASAQSVAAHRPVELSFSAAQAHTEPFARVELDVVFSAPDGAELRVPAFHAGDERWKVRYASAQVGTHRYRSVCSASDDPGLHGREGTIEVTPAEGANPLYAHGPLRISADRRRFEHADGTSFLWLGDTWWKGLCKRLSERDFAALCAQRAAQGFNVVQIVCGPYPDEELLDPRGANAAGLPYTAPDFRTVNPAYFEAAEKRIQQLLDHGLLPAIVGGWGRPQAGGRSTIDQVGLEGYRRHWRHLIARFGASPVVWILGGEASDGNGPWAALANDVRALDPFRRPLTYHAPGDPRLSIREGNERFDYDMIALGHDGSNTANATLAMLRATLAQQPARPALCGEACYERHMQSNFEDVQRHLFWTLMLAGAAGHTYGAAGIWHASVPGDPGITPVYDWTTWREGLDFPGAQQLGLAKRFLEELPWQRMEPQPTWVDAGLHAAGIPNELVLAYLPKRGIYDWSGFEVRGLAPTVRYTALWFDPASGRRFPLGEVTGSERYATPPVPSPQDWVLLLRAP